MKTFIRFSYRRMIAFIVSLALFMDALDTTIINTAIPAISRSMNVHPVDLKIALISYLISLAIFIPISGWVGDKFGIKRVFICAMGIFTLSSLWCGYASTLYELVAARCLQGVGGSLMLPLGRLIILRTFHRHELVDTMNNIVMVVSLGLMLGPVAGGFITDRLSWNWIFWINIPVGIITMLMTAFFLKDGETHKVRPFDFPGFILFGVGLAGLTFALSDLSESASNQQTAWYVMFMAIFMLLSYALYSFKQTHPFINTELFNHRTFRTSIMGNLLARLGFGGIPFLLPLLLQVALGYSAELSGMLLVPIALGVFLVKYGSLRLLKLAGYKKLLMINTILIGLSLWAFQIIDASTPIFIIACLTFLFGLLISQQFSAMNSLAYADLPTDEFSSATGIISTTQQIAQSFGVAVSALLLRYYSSSDANNFNLSPYVFHQTFFALGCITFFSAVIFLKLQPGDGLQMLKAPAQDKISAH